jgi:predicted fused transcriptional regulator/phosphomethylpyrimidine kinase
MIRSLRERTRSVQCRVPGTGEHVIRWVLSFDRKMAHCRAVAVISHVASCLSPRTERIRPMKAKGNLY